jgi:hypothetical protein
VAAAQVGRRARFGLRVNPDVEAGPHPYLRTGHDETKFGCRPVPRSSCSGGSPRVTIPTSTRSGSTCMSAPSSPTQPSWPPARGSRWVCSRPAGGSGSPLTGSTSAAACRSPTTAARPPRRRHSPPRWPPCWPDPGLGYRSSPAGRAVVVDTGMHHLLRPPCTGRGTGWCRSGCARRPVWSGWSGRSASRPTCWRPVRPARPGPR